MASYHDIQQLKELFPNVNEDVIIQVLRRNKNNVNRAVDTLLAMSDETESQQSQAPSVVISHSQPTPAVVSPPLPMHHPLSQTNHGRRRLIIVRGLPGSGKSTLARYLVGSNGTICSTDDYFMVNGRYIFDRDKLSEYHERNQARAISSMTIGKSPVIIDNTNTCAWEMKPYVVKGLELGYDVEFVEPQTDWKFNVDQLARRNGHGVDRNIIEKMKDRYEKDMTVDKVLNSSQPQPFNSRSVPNNPLRYDYPRYDRHNNHDTSSYRSGPQVNRYLTEFRPQPDNQELVRKWLAGKPEIHVGPNVEVCTESDVLKFSPPVDTNNDNKFLFSNDGNRYKVDKPINLPSSYTSSTTIGDESFNPTGGTHTHTGGTHAHTGGIHAHTGGAHAHTGGTHAHTGGTYAHTGGTHAHTGGTHAHTEGTHAHTGGTHAHTGLTHAHTGGIHAHTISEQPIISTNIKTSSHQFIDLCDENDDTNDLEFLTSCFTNLSPVILQKLYEKANKDLMATVDLALHLPVADSNRETTPTDSDSEIELMNETDSLVISSSSDEEVEDHDDTGREEYGEMIRDIATTFGMKMDLNKESNEKDEGRGGMPVKVRNTGVTPDSDEMKSKSEPVDASAIGCDDDNLLLRLTPSFAKQLQSMFGKVLPNAKDEIQDGEDLIVLLNERVACGIFQKWRDTLEAKRIEQELTSQKKRKPDKVISGMANQRRHDQKGGVNHTPLTQIMNEQAVEAIGQQEVDNRIEKAMKESTSVRLNVQELYDLFPSISHSVVHWNYYKSELDYDKTKSKLSNIAPSKAAAVNQPKAISKRTLSPRPQVVSGSRQDDVEEEVDYDYDELRAEAAVYAKLRSEAFQKAAAARNQKQWQLATYYAQQGQMHTEKMKDANRRAAEMTFKIKNKGRPSDTLDLHNLHVDEALQVLMETLHNYKGSQLLVITGRGNHSKGPAKIRPAVINFLSSGKWRYQAESGSVTVFLK